MAEPRIQQLFDMAVRSHQAGRLEEAEPLYRQILQQRPDHAEAMHYLGVIAQQRGQAQQAMQLMRQAIGLRPHFPDAYYNLGVVLAGASQFVQAVEAYRQAIALRPNHAGTYYNLGIALAACGQAEEAIAAYRQAIVLNPRHARALGNLGLALKERGQLEEAVAAIRQSLSLNPNSAETHANLGVALHEQSRLDEAIAAYRQAIALNPELVAAHSNLGVALAANGQSAEGEAACRQAIALNPKFAKAFSNLSVVLKGHGQTAQAVAAARQAVALAPSDAKAHNNLGVALIETGQAEEAIAALGWAVRLAPNDAEPLCNLGNALADAGRFSEAIAAYHQAIALRPDSAEAHCNLGVALKRQGQVDEAIAEYRRALALRPDYADAYNNLGDALKEAGLLDEAIAAFRRAIELSPKASAANDNLLYTIHFHPGYAAGAIAEEHRRWSEQVAAPLRGWKAASSTGPGQADVTGAGQAPSARSGQVDLDVRGRRLRVGYVSSNFRNHPVGRFLAPLMDHHDHRQFEIFCYSDVAQADAMTARIQGRADVWRHIVGQSDEDVALSIHSDQIDILVDLTMHMARNRMLVFARKPAPVQATYLAYCSTTGLETMDYRLSDRHLDPPGQGEQYYSERTVRLADVYWCYEPDAAAPAVAALPALQTGQVTFGCLNNFAKVSPDALLLWIKLLRQTPGSRLVLHARPGEHRRRVLDQMQKQGVDPGRLAFVDFLQEQDYLRQYQQIDIGLDPFPCAGGTTTCDALWMGVPIVTLRGQTAVGRAGVTLLNSIGLGELVAHTPEQYLALARELANDLPKLEQLRTGMRQRMLASPLMDAAKFARSIEAAYLQMWREKVEKIAHPER